MTGLWAFEVRMPFQKYQGSAIVVRCHVIFKLCYNQIYQLKTTHKRNWKLTVLICILYPHACIYCMHTKYYQAISKIPKFLLGVNVSWICLSLKRKFWKQMFIYIVCHNNVVKSFLKLHFLLPYICIFMRFLLFLNYFCYDCMN